MLVCSLVGEECDSAGARFANANPRGSRFLINGEPTGNHMALATKGALRVELRAHGGWRTPPTRSWVSRRLPNWWRRCRAGDAAGHRAGVWRGGRDDGEFGIISAATRPTLLREGRGAPAGAHRRAIARDQGRNHARGCRTRREAHRSTWRACGCDAWANCLRWSPSLPPT